MAVKTHYDNLKVARNASDEVIRAAYRSLSEKYHPDRYPGSTEAARIRKILDDALNALTDPARREEHGQWIAREEQRETMERVDASAPPPTFRAKLKCGVSTFLTWVRVNGRGKRMGMSGLLVAALVLFIAADHWGWLNNNTARLAQPYDAAPAPDPTPVQPTYIPPVVTAPKLAQAYSASPVVSQTVTAPRMCQHPLTPKGFPWPDTASYLKVYPERARNGHSVVHIDNLQGESDVLVKLVATSGPTASPVRVFYIPAHGQFTATNLPPGTYDVRFCALMDGALSRSGAFMLKEIPDAEGGGLRYTHYDLTLYTVINGNMQIYPLNPADF